MWESRKRYADTPLFPTCGTPATPRTRRPNRNRFYINARRARRILTIYLPSRWTICIIPAIRSLLRRAAETRARAVLCKQAPTFAGWCEETRITCRRLCRHVQKSSVSFYILFISRLSSLIFTGYFHIINFHIRQVYNSTVIFAYFCR